MATITLTEARPAYLSSSTSTLPAADALAIERDVVDALVAWAVNGPGGEPAIDLVDAHVERCVHDVAVVEDALRATARRFGAAADDTHLGDLATVELHRALTGRYAPDEMRGAFRELFARDVGETRAMRAQIENAVAHFASGPRTYGSERYLAALREGLRIIDAALS